MFGSPREAVRVKVKVQLLKITKLSTENHYIFFNKIIYITYRVYVLLNENMIDL